MNGSNTAADTAFCSTAAMALGSTPTAAATAAPADAGHLALDQQNYVDHNLTNTASIPAFVEDNWLGGQRIGGGSFDAISGRLDVPTGLLDFFTAPHFRPATLNPTTGEVVSG